MSKQDRQGARTPADLERKYNFGKTFSEIMGVATDARDSVDALGSELRDEILEQATSITRDTESIVIAALERYVETSDLEEFEKTIRSEFAVMNDKITMSFTNTEKQVSSVNSDLQTFMSEFSKYITFASDTAITIGSGDSAITLEIDNEKGIIFNKNGQQFRGYDAKKDEFHTGNLVVDVEERATFGNFGFATLPDGSLVFGKVGA